MNIKMWCVYESPYSAEKYDVNKILSLYYIRSIYIKSNSPQTNIVNVGRIIEVKSEVHRGKFTSELRYIFLPCQNRI